MKKKYQTYHCKIFNYNYNILNVMVNMSEYLWLDLHVIYQRRNQMTSSEIVKMKYHELCIYPVYVSLE